MLKQNVQLFEGWGCFVYFHLNVFVEGERLGDGQRGQGRPVEGS